MVLWRQIQKWMEHSVLLFFIFIFFHPFIHFGSLLIWIFINPSPSGASLNWHFYLKTLWRHVSQNAEFKTRKLYFFHRFYLTSFLREIWVSEIFLLFFSRNMLTIFPCNLYSLFFWSCAGRIIKRHIDFSYNGNANMLKRLVDWYKARSGDYYWDNNNTKRKYGFSNCIRLLFLKRVLDILSICTCIDVFMAMNEE